MRLPWRYISSAYSSGRARIGGSRRRRSGQQRARNVRLPLRQVVVGAIAYEDSSSADVASSGCSFFGPPVFAPSCSGDRIILLFVTDLRLDEILVVTIHSKATLPGTRNVTGEHRVT
eukprot:6189239-Pleurochrysis_carterae.AAC.1